MVEGRGIEVGVEGEVRMEGKGSGRTMLLRLSAFDLCAIRWSSVNLAAAAASFLGVS